jgi:hypothetical protein
VSISITLTSEQYVNVILGLCYAEVRFGEAPQAAVMKDLINEISNNANIV